MIKKPYRDGGKNMAQLLKNRDYINLGATELMTKAAEVMTKRKLEIQAIMEEVEHDLEVAQAAEEAQRECGTLTPEELRRQFTI